MSEDKTNTPDELLDLVDENDHAIGTVAKDAANHDPSLIHREAGILIYDDHNRLLLQQRSHLNNHEPGMWMVAAAGHVTKGEEPEAAAHRELQEELGFDRPLTLYEKVLVNMPKETHFSYRYLGKYNGETINCQTEEVERAKFFTQKEYELLAESGTPINKSSAAVIKRFWAGELDEFKH